MNLEDPGLIKKYGSWVRVQVEFYDFLFIHGLENPNVREVTQEMIEGFRDGEDPYEHAVARIEKRFLTLAEAWDHFVEKS